MNIRDMQQTNYYIQCQQFAARVLLTIWLLAIGSPEGVLATSKRQPTMVPAATASPGDPSLASTPPTPGGQLAPGSLWGNSVSSIPATDAALQGQLASHLLPITLDQLPSQLASPRPQAVPRTLAGPVAEGIEELPVRENALEIAQNLIDAARDEQWSDREDFLEELTQVVLDTPSKMQDILSKLTEAAEDPNEAVRLIVLEAFASLAPVASSAAETILPILTQAAKDEDYDTRLVSLQALAKMAIAAPSEASGIMPILEAAAKDRDEDIREIALEALSMVPQTASSETTTTTVPEDTADKQALYLENLLQLKAAHKPALPRPEPEVQQKVTFSAEEHVQALLVLQRELSELQAEKARHAQELTQLAEKKSAAESANAELRGELQAQKARHAQELVRLAEEKSAAELANAELRGELQAQKARHAQELVQLADEKSAVELANAELQDKLQAQEARYTQEFVQLPEKKSATELANAELRGELQAQKAWHAQELVRLADEKSAAESAKAELQEQKAPHTQELDPLATGKLAAEPQQALHEEQVQLLSAQEHAYKELLVDSMKKDSELQELKSALERAQRTNEALLSENEQLRSAQGKKPEASSPLSEDAMAGKKPGVTSYPLAEDTVAGKKPEASSLLSEDAVAGKKPEVTSSPLSEDAVSDKAQEVPSSVIDASVWQQYFGDVGATPPLPDGIEEILNSPCPFWEGKQVRETHLLALIPAQVAGQPLTLDYLGELIQSPQGEGHATKYRYYWDEVRQAIGNQSPDSSYWVLMTRDVLSGSRSKSYQDQCALVARHQDYIVPGILEAAIVVLLHHARSGERLYSDSPWTYTSCWEKVGNFQLAVGGFSSGGLYINYHNYDTSRNVGIAALRKFGAFPLLGDDAVSDKAQGVLSLAMPGGLVSSATPGSLVPSFVPVSAIPGGVASPVLDASVWQQYFGDVGATPPLPDNIEDILNSPCPFWEGKQVKGTHLLVLIPSHVAGQPLTLDYLGELIQSPQGGGYATKYGFYWDDARKAIGSKASGSSYWVLMTRNVLPGSRNQRYEDQRKLVADHANRTGLSYEVPGALEAAVVMLLHHVRSGERLYSVNPFTYTRCQERVRNFQLVVGGFSSGGLDVVIFVDYFSNVGVAGLRKF